MLQPKMEEMQKMKAGFDFKNGVVMEFTSTMESKSQ
jgi:hypothetical protein